jgi:hypothetical protein
LLLLGAGGVGSGALLSSATSGAEAGKATGAACEAGVVTTSGVIASLDANVSGVSPGGKTQ